MKKNHCPYQKQAAGMLGAVLLSVPAWAQGATPEAIEKGITGLPVPILLAGCLVGLLLLGVLLFACIIFIQLFPVLHQFYDHPARRYSAMARFLALFRGDARVFTGKVNDVLMEDHDYDGIQEFDNDLPPWWKYLFYVTAVFGVVYLVHFHVMGGKLQTAEYEAEMQQAAILSPQGGNGNANEKTDYKLLTEAAKLNAGQASYIQNCAACHGQNAEGMVGPNLTDKYWLHGGEVNEVFRTIKFGVTSKGMVAWQGKLSDDQILEVASYLLSLQGSRPANAKAPQGEKVVAQ